MNPIKYYSTNDKSKKVSFETALLTGQPEDYGLYMVKRSDLPTLDPAQIKAAGGQSYAQIAFQVLNPFLGSEIPPDELKKILQDAYREDRITTRVERVTGKTYIMWLTRGPTYSFKDYAARFFGRALNYFLDRRGLRRTVVVATSGDTGGAVADALYGLDNVDNVVFFPAGSISSGQRKQMTTLGKNIYAFRVNGDFDICQALAKNILGDKEYANQVFDDPDRITSANSISLGRLLPQIVYPFYAYSRIARSNAPMNASIPSGNFGDMMGTLLAKGMGLPISKIICGVNENREFADFLKSGEYNVQSTKKSPSTAMNVSHPSNLARLIDFYGGHIYDKRDPVTKKVVNPGVIDKMPDMEAMRNDIYSVGVSNREHYRTIKEVFDTHGVILDPHGAVGWKALEIYNSNDHDQPAVVYETADPGKFPEDVQKAIGIKPEVPPGMKKQANKKERIYSIENSPEETDQGLKLTDSQVSEAKAKIKEL